MSKKPRIANMQRRPPTNQTSPMLYTHEQLRAAWIRAVQVMEDYYSAREALIVQLVLIDYLAARSALSIHDRDSARRELAGMDETLGSYIVGFNRQADRAGVKAPGLDELVYERIEGIKRFVNATDNGEYLRAAVNQTGGQQIQAMLQEAGKISRTRGLDERTWTTASFIQDLLNERPEIPQKLAIHKVAEYEGISPDTARKRFDRYRKAQTNKREP